MATPIINILDVIIIQNTPSNGGFLSNIPSWVKIAISLISGGLGAYIVRQFIERWKLKKSLKSEIKEMSGLERCKQAMQNRNRKPSNENLKPEEIPPEGSIPTNIFEANVQRLGLLKSKDLENVVGFYSRVLYYKSIIKEIRSGKDVPDPDQNDFYESIATVEERRQKLFGKEWMNPESDMTYQNDRD